MWPIPLSEDNLKAMGEELQFIYRLPNNFNLVFELTKDVFIRNDWLELERMKSASYKLKEFKRELYGQQYRFLVVHFNHLNKRKLRGFNTKKTNLKKQQ
jgi:hypothetical protein